MRLRRRTSSFWWPHAVEASQPCKQHSQREQILTLRRLWFVGFVQAPLPQSLCRVASTRPLRGAILSSSSFSSKRRRTLTPSTPLYVLLVDRVRLTGGQTYTALHLASEGGHVDVMALLVSAGASIHAKTKYVRCCIDHRVLLTAPRRTRHSITHRRRAE